VIANKKAVHFLTQGQFAGRPTAAAFVQSGKDYNELLSHARKGGQANQISSQSAVDVCLRFSRSGPAAAPTSSAQLRD
jgi:hypothetical protein